MYVTVTVAEDVPVDGAVSFAVDCRPLKREDRLVGVATVGIPKSQSVTPPAADVILFSQLSTMGIYIVISILYYELIHNPNHGI